MFSSNRQGSSGIASDHVLTNYFKSQNIGINYCITFINEDVEEHIILLQFNTFVSI